MSIRLLIDNEFEEYKELAKSAGSVFSSLSWVKLFGDKVKLFGIFDNSDKLIGGFQLYTTSLYGLKYFRNPPYTPNISLFFINKSQNQAKIQSSTKNILSELSNFLKKLPFQIISVGLPANITDSQPFTWDGFKVIPSFTYQIDLSSSLDTIHGEMMAERRNDIKKAEKDHIETRLEENYQVVSDLVKNTFDRQNKSLDEIHLNKILTEFANKENSFAFTSYQENIPISTCFCVYDEHTVYYLLGGYDKNNRHKGAGAMAIWKSIEYAKALNRNVFDFEGSMVKPIERYFRGFGGRLTPYYTINRAWFCIEMGLKIFKREQF